MKTIIVKVIETLKGTYWLNSRVSEGFRSFMSCANGRAIYTNWLTWRTLGLLISFLHTAFKRVTPSSAFDIFKGRSSNGGTCMINDSSGSGKDNRNLVAGMVEREARTDPMIICPVWVFIPHTRVMMQIWQPTKDLEEDDVAKDDDSRNVKSALADVISQIPKPRFVACSILSKVIAVVSQTASASIALKNAMLQCQKGVLSALGRLRSKFGTSTNRDSAQIVPQIRRTIQVCFQKDLNLELRCSM